MDPSSSIFNNCDIEAAKRRIKCDSILFLVCFFIPWTLVWLIANDELALYFIFWLSTIFSPYALTAIFGFCTSQNENSYANCYSSMLKCTFIYSLLSIGISGIASLWVLYIILTFQCDSSRSETCGLDKAIAILVFIIAFLYFILSISAFTLWWFSNKHINYLKDLISRRVQNFQNPVFAGTYTTNAQFMPVPGIPIGRNPGSYFQYNPANY
ncbi:unnamed protein product [Blepharisma stoltei]|uniref:Uncharacterized protein n=1 Tax=Blepharisma stoltei TaxID=1481888 RepID=A0AAU9J5D3_9CILI|nr:unnamed protein product [Blepharisma stoltei]